MSPTMAADENEFVIDAEGLTKSFGNRTVVRDLTIRVRRGRIFGFLGANGSGKTTTIRMLAGLLRPDAGRGTCLGYDITTQTEMLKRHVGYMTQHFSLYTDLSIRQNLEFVARVHELPHPRRQARAAIERLGLAGREDQLAGALSGGWKQRLALSACILPGPELLLLDEPTAGVDPKARRDFWNNIHDLAAEGMTVLVSTHYMDEAERCHELAYLSAGQILTRGTAQEVIENSHLTTWTVSGPDLSELAKRIKTLPGIESVTPFGTTLHVSGTDAARIEKSISGLLDGPQKWERAEVTLEDVFIHMMGVAGDGEA